MLSVPNGLLFLNLVRFCNARLLKLKLLFLNMHSVRLL